MYLPALLALLVHFPVLFSDLIWDDNSLIVEHPQIADPAFVSRVFLRDYGFEMGGRAPNGYYRPFLMLINTGLYRLFGPSPLAYHVFVLLMFGFSATLLTWLCLRILGQKYQVAAIAAGCLAAVHPARTELAVFFMSLPDLLIEIFAVLIILLAWRNVEETGGRGKLEIALCMISCLALAFLSGITKETAFFTITAIGCAMFLYGLSRGKSGWPLLAMTSALVLGIVLAYLLRTVAGVRQPEGGLCLGLLAGEGSGRAIHAALLSASELLIPSPVVFMNWTDKPATAVTRLLVFFPPALIAGSVLYLIFRRRLFATLLAAWFGAGLFSLMMIRAFNLPYSERYVPTAPAMIGLCVLAAAAWYPLIAGHPWFGERIPKILLAGYIGLQGVFSFSGATQCITSVGFFTAMARDNPTLHYPRIILAKIMFYKYGDFEKMDRYAQEAIAIAPDVAKVRELGALYARRYIAEKKYSEALSYLDWAEQVLKNDGEIYSLRAICQSALGEHQKAETSILRALEMDPANRAYRKQQSIIQAARASR